MVYQLLSKAAIFFCTLAFIYTQCPMRAVIAQACPSCGAEIANVALAEAVVSKKQKGELLITDSLWGNLILDMAYQRDPQIKKIMKRLNMVNLGTIGAVTGIAGGTLAQGVISLATLNPPEGKMDSYLPGAIGIGMSGLTIVTFAGRTIINHNLTKQLRARQLAIKHRVEGLLDHLENANGQCLDAQNELVSLIGERATNEWLQLWRSSTVAATKLPNISLMPTANSSVPVANARRSHL